jgi:glycosyltransferase involved in cell wall biosynthesis
MSTETRSPVVALFVAGPVERWIPTIVSLSERCHAFPMMAGARDPSELAALEEVAARWEAALQVEVAGDVGDLVGKAALQFNRHVVLISAPVILPSGAFKPALELADADLRCASVSFFSNAAGHLSFPGRDAPSTHQVGKLDEEGVTQRLRKWSLGLIPTPIAYATGPAVLLTKQGLSVVWPPPQHAHDLPELMLADYSARARARGMVDYLDPSTFISRPRDVVDQYPNDSKLTPAAAAWLGEREPALVRATAESSEWDSAFAQVFDLARSAVFGLRIVIDATCVGPSEMGTQVAVLGLIAALAERADIRYLGVAIGGRAPGYAAEVLSHPKLDVRMVPDGNLKVFPQVDLVHRPFQPDSQMNLASWRVIARRTVMTINDLIAYQVPGYHEDSDAWFQYRARMRTVTAGVDALFVLSDDVSEMVLRERLQIDGDRIFVVPVGTDHIGTRSPEVLPDELWARGFTGDEFLLVLGTNYSHKNRDVAVRILKELLDRGHAISLVMAGAHVPYGSSRAAEAAAWSPGLPAYVVPDVSSAERNWLLRHANLVVYPTSAEGFGMVPEEAASFGTPTVFVPFGPFVERFDTLPVSPRDWSIAAFADAAEALLNDPQLAAKQAAAILGRGDSRSWSAAADAAMAAYRVILARPARHRLETRVRLGGDSTDGQ